MSVGYFLGNSVASIPMRLAPIRLCPFIGRSREITRFFAIKTENSQNNTQPASKDGCLSFFHRKTRLPISRRSPKFLSLPEIAIVILSSFLSLSLGTFPVHIIRAQVSYKIGKSEITRVGHQLMSDLLLLFELGVFLEVL